MIQLARDTGPCGTYCVISSDIYNPGPSSASAPELPAPPNKLLKDDSERKSRFKPPGLTIAPDRSQRAAVAYARS